MEFEYFSQDQSEQFTFYRIPKVLFQDIGFSSLSTDAKVLYGLFLDRVSLSKRNGWIDDHGRVYVYYTLLRIQDDLSCASQKAMKLLRELEDFGLIERVKQGQGKPTRIYVMNFIPVRKSPVQTDENHQSGIVKITSPDYRKSKGNNTEINNTDINNTNPILSKREMDGIGLDERSQYQEYFNRALSIDILKERYPNDKEVLESIYELIIDTVCSRRKTICIAGDDRPADVVKGRFMKLNSSHVEYALGCINETTTKVRNMKQYMLAALYNAPVTIDSYYTTLVHHDMAEGKI
ncbi:DUF6017 domain-containing protein [Butyrivibrio sp. INlla14]|uniref:DUF6017 domain-containing protein n=1 Tax=Butyrivibrio sp. INlla14 TaxID=1520808 RepID=UPI000876E151|nr:DUF6017 domain-containing protein [Butyrivibrio sp. INlla14]SCY10919.1 Replication initiator protein A (RepA) N-terminus [Butyrivibrio sp. INlla14]